MGLLPRSPLVLKQLNLDGPQFAISLEAAIKPSGVIQIRGTA